MADRVVPGPVSDRDTVSEAVCIDTRKIMDSCRDKDCVEDLRVFPTVASLPALDGAISVRPRGAELLRCSVRVRDISLNRGYYTVDVTYFYRVRGEAFPSGLPITGLAIFDKRVMLFGSEGRVRSFASDDCLLCGADSSMPYAVVDAVDPIALHMSIVEGTPVEPAAEQRDIPDTILDDFDGEVSLANSGRQLTVSLGQFSIIRLVRNTQLVIPAYDYCVPEKECVGSTEDDPCTLFGRIRFPVDEFFPPDQTEAPTDYGNMV